MWRDVLEQVSELGNLVPRFTAPRCLLVRQAVGGCDACQVACPHEAIRLGEHLGVGITIDPQKCTGCGLCVQSCPTGALEYDLTGPLEALQAQKDGGEAVLCCSQSGAPAPSLPCLGRVTPGVVSAAGAWNLPITLLHGDCAACPVGAGDVPERLQEVIQQTQQLRAATGRPAQVTLRRSTDIDRGRSVGVSRRGAFAALLRAGQKQVIRQLPERPLPFVDWSVPAERLPAEWRWRARTLRPTPAPDTPIHWPAPLIGEGCIDCPVCANVCPTEAITRDLQPDGGVQLHLNLSACTGCMACQRSCPPQVIHRQEQWFYAALETTVLLRESGSVM
ncbi:4Fe-4S dicluster domain-containing protein [Deinococcus fonticola]|uniref:4Fe-4S dicluster domain-containing protein n=1 Tax=Deinococcus fonticola TaxID=2528713 RepID=UPI00107586CA|nr:4Fe-4S dicluster domain-containing protein [Deinococcus fonticola]